MSVKGARLHIAESPAAYRRRPRLVADASVLAAAIFGDEEEREPALAFLQGRSLTAPHLVDCEMASVALKKLRRERLPEAAVEEALSLFASLDIERHAVAPEAIFALARRYDLTAYDAAYLWLAEHLEAPLATFDQALAEAARRHFRPD